MTAKKTTAKKVSAPRPPARKKVAKVIDTENRIMDFDVLKAARAEASGLDGAVAPRIKIGGETYELPLELPASYMLSLGAIGQGDVAQISLLVEQIFGEYADEIVGKMDIHDLKFFVNRIPELYGADLGESQDSSPS